MNLSRVPNYLLWMGNQAMPDGLCQASVKCACKKQDLWSSCFFLGSTHHTAGLLWDELRARKVWGRASETWGPSQNVCAHLCTQSHSGTTGGVGGGLLGSDKKEGLA